MFVRLTQFPYIIDKAGIMELTFITEPVTEGMSDICYLHRQYEQAVPHVAIIYRNGEYKSKVYANKVEFVDSIENNIIGVKSSEVDRFKEWNGSKVTVLLLPRYYIHPWKSVIVGVSEGIKK